MLKRVAVIAVLFAVFFLGACGSTSPNPTPTPTTTGTPIDPSVSGPLAGTLAAQAASLNGSAALSAQAAAVALQAGVQADNVALTAGQLARLPTGANRVPSRSSSTVSSGAGQAFAFQLTVVNAPQGPSTQVFSGVVLFQGSTGAALATGPSPQSAIPPGVGLILSGGMLWEATSGQESAQLSVSTGTCPNTPPAFITACSLAVFTNAGFAITASTAVAGGATGSQSVSIPATGLVGAALTLDCSKTPLCGVATSVQVAVNPPAPTLQPNATQQFAATVTGTSNTAVTWSVTESGGGSVSPTGLYTAPSAPGTFHVVATSVADPLESGTATVTVSSPPVVTVSISPTAPTVVEGGTQQFTATVSGTSNTSVTWSVEESGGGSVSSSGLYTAPSTSGTFHVVAASVADTSKTAVATVTVSATPVVAVTISPTAPTVAEDGTQLFTATVTGTSNTAVTWSVEETGGGSVSTTGLYTAPGTSGTFHVVATSVADTSKTAVATVTVSAPVVAVRVSPPTATVQLNSTEQFTALVTGTSNTAVTWSVEETGGGSVSSTGLYTAPSTAGSFHVVATSDADTTKSAQATVTVPSSAFIGSWYGPYTIVLGSQYLSGNVTVPITPGSPGNAALLSINFLCVAPNFVQATITSPTTFTIQPITCPLESTTCATATLSFTSGIGTLNSSGELNLSFAGSENVCGTVTDFNGTFGPGMYQGL